MADAVSRLPLRRFGTYAGLLDPGSKVVPAARLLAVQEAGALIESATRRAQAITSQATAGYDAQCRRGYEAGLTQAKLEQASQVIENVAKHVNFLEKSEDRIVDLVMQAVRTVIEGFDEKERTVAAVRSVLSAAREQKQVTLRLNPALAESLKVQIQEMVIAYPGMGFVDVVAERGLTGDACVLESEMGVIETSIEIQLEAIQSVFDKTLGRQG